MLNLIHYLAAFIDRKKKMQPIEIRKIFSLIKDDDVRMLGLNPEFARPEWLIITNLPVGPPAVRPSVMVDFMYRFQKIYLTF